MTSPSVKPGGLFVGRQAQVGEQAAHAFVIRRHREAAALHGLRGGRVGRQLEQRDGELAGQLRFGGGEGGDRPLREEPGGQRGREGRILLPVDDAQAGEVETALAAHRLDHAGAHEGGVGLAGEQRIDRAVLRHAGLDQLDVERHAHAGLLQHLGLGQKAAQRFLAGGGDPVAAQVAEAAQVLVVGADDDDAADRRGRHLLFVVDQRRQRRTEAVAAGEDDVMGRIGQHEADLVAGDRRFQLAAVEGDDAKALAGDRRVQVVGERLPAFGGLQARPRGQDADVGRCRDGCAGQAAKAGQGKTAQKGWAG